MEYFVYMTNDCNLHCHYCSVLLDCKENNLPIKPTYSPESIVNFIRRTQNECNDNEVNIYFFGGEPTIEYPSLIKLVQNLCTALPSELVVKFVLHTNGLVLDQIPDELLDSLSLIMFSINYEKIPKYNMANGYFNNVINNAIEIKLKKNVPMIARLTITEKTSVYTEILLISNYFDLIYWQIENCFAFKDFESFFDTYTFEIKLTFEYWLRYLECGTMLKLVPFMAVLKFMFFPDRDNNEFSCGYSKGMVYIQTNGNCYACSDSMETGVHYMGNLKDGVTFKKYSLDSFQCEKCKYRSLCMGRCGRMHIEFETQHISQYCKLNQYMFDLFIQNRDVLQLILLKYPAMKEELDSRLLQYTEFTP